MDTIQLGPADLGANRQGQLSAGQKERLRRLRRLSAAGAGGFFLLLLASAVVLLLKWRNPAFAARGQLFIALPLVAFWLWLLRRQPGQWRRLGRDLRRGGVATVEGGIQTLFDFGPGLFRSVRYRVALDGRRFRVPADAFHRLRPGDPYRIYYAPHSGAFLGALPLIAPEQGAINDASPAPLFEPLTGREAEVLALIAAGLSNREIAAQLHLSVNTVKMYASQMYGKLGVSRRTEAVARARELNLL